MLQGLSPGWGDTYDYYRPDQWIDLGPNGHLADGQYVMRSVVDPLNKVYESQGKANSATESATDNEAITEFSIQSGGLVDSNPPTGSVRINDIDSGTTTPNVTVKVLGRDDISGAADVKLSSDGNQWSAPQAYTGTGSTAQAIAWDLTDPAYGGNSNDGTKTVFAEFQDATGKWSEPVEDTIVLDRGGSTSSYSNSVSSDYPAAYWRLGDAVGPIALDHVGNQNGTYANGPTLGQPSLLKGDSNASVAFDGVNDYVGVPSTSSLSPTARVSLEAWIKPTSLPSSGNFASVLTKAESYSLQFNGPKMEFTIIQSGTRRRLQAPSGAIVAGQAYHVVGTYDGTTQRLYINGAQVASAPLTGAISTNSNPLTIGAWGGGQEFFKGTIDEPAVYGSVLSTARVSAHYQAGIGGSAPDPTVKDPTNLNASAVSDNQINLSWNDNSTNEGEFLIERDSSPDFNSPVIESVWANSTIFTDSGLSPETTYYYRVKAKNATDSSGYSNTASATTLSTSPPPQGYAAEAIADSPTSYWRLGETSGAFAMDERGLNPGAYANGPTLGQPSLLGSDLANAAASFDGVNDYVAVLDSTGLDSSSSLSLEAWIKPTSLPSSGNFASVLTKAESYSLQFNGPKMEFTIIQSGTRRRLQAPSGAIVAGQAYHVVGTYDGTTQRLYINGAQVASAPLTGAISTNSNPLTIGAWGGGQEFFKGTIDEPAVYGSVLSTARVSARYQTGIGGSAPDPTVKEPDQPQRQRGLRQSDQPELKKRRSTNETQFVLEHTRGQPSRSPQSTVLGANFSSYTSTGLTTNTTYYYRVKAANSTNESGYSNPASATTLSQASGDYRAGVIADGPTSYWRLGEASGGAAVDERDANPGTYANGPTLGQPSLLKGGLQTPPSPSMGSMTTSVSPARAPSHRPPACPSKPGSSRPPFPAPATSPRC